ncbi:unnamed protein product [Nesidiocoris tenuis]|uniref:Uncharacterized protein n=1 Tax=Nesidiocoris tenuis TaxID=355587 RepID=A0A6H5HGG6_9HEMI|nr:unnamed protein product [Nesidiocoris tenuis]
MNRHDDRDMCLRVRGKCGVKRNWPTILDEEWVTWIFIQILFSGWVVPQHTVFTASAVVSNLEYVVRLVTQFTFPKNTFLTSESLD